MELTKERATVAILVLMGRQSIEAYGRTDYTEMRAPKRNGLQPRCLLCIYVHLRNVPLGRS